MKESSVEDVVYASVVPCLQYAFVLKLLVKEKGLAQKRIDLFFKKDGAVIVVVNIKEHFAMTVS